jgi:FkbM family methyltransferase
MTEILRNIFRSAYYAVYGGSGKKIRINDEEYRVSAYVARGINSIIDEVPLKLLSNMSRNASVVFDVGANIGIIAMILAKKMKPGSMIYSFEPAPLSFKYLRDNARVQNGNATITAVNVAVSNNNDKLYFTNDGNSCTNHIAAGKNEGTISVDATTIDGFCKANKVIPEVIKIDIEGAEYWALLGMQQTLKNNNCLVLVEIHTVFLQDNNITGQMFADLVGAIGYKVFDTTGNQINANLMLDHDCVILSKEKPAAEIFNIS